MSRRTSSPISLFSFQDIITTVVGVMLLIILILLLQLISQMFAAPPVPTMTEEEIKQQIEEVKPVLTKLENSIAELQLARERSEVRTPSQEEIDAVRSTIDQLKTNVAATDKRIEEIQKRIEELQNNPVMPQLEKMEQEVVSLNKQHAELTQQTGGITALQREERILSNQNTVQNQQVANRVKTIVVNETNKTPLIVDFGGTVGGRSPISVHREDGSQERTFSSQTDFFVWANGKNPSRDHFVIYVRPSRFGQERRVIEVLRTMKFEVGLQVIGEKTNLFF